MNGIRKKEIEEFLNTNFSFRTEKIELYNEALTHSSNGLPNNQRLAFLGDSVLRLIIREHYFSEHPDWDKGELTKKCSETIEPNKNFANIASNLEIVKYIKFGKTYDNRPDDKENATISAEAFEALFGAVYCDQGLDKAKEVAGKLKMF